MKPPLKPSGLRPLLEKATAGVLLGLYDLISGIAERYENCVCQEPALFGLTPILRPSGSIIPCWIINVCRENGFLNDTTNLVGRHARLPFYT